MDLKRQVSTSFDSYVDVLITMTAYPSFDLIFSILSIKQVKLQT